LQAKGGKQNKGAEDAKKQVRSIGLLVDGSQFGPESWKLAADAVRAHGELAHITIFAPPREDVQSRAEWAAALCEVGATHYPVGRTQGSSKDPNDTAMGFAAGFFAGRGQVDAIALLAEDSDFQFLVRQIISCGCRVLWLWPTSLQWPAILHACGAERIPYKPDITGGKAA